MFITPKWLKDHQICEAAQNKLEKESSGGTDHLEILKFLEEAAKTDYRMRRWYVVFKRKFGRMLETKEKNNGQRDE